MTAAMRREWILTMKMDDQTRREREQLNRSLGDVEKSAKKARDEASRGIVDVAKASKQNLEGIKAVLELGGWLMMAQQVAAGIADITKEARASSEEFQRVGATLDVVKNTIGTGIVKALEPLMAGLSDVLITGTAVFQNFPKVAGIAFEGIKKIIGKVLSWEGLKTIALTLGEGWIKMFTAAIEYIPRLFNAAIQLMLNPIYRLGEYFSDTISKALSGNFKDIESPLDFLGRVWKEQVVGLGNLGADAISYVQTQASNVMETVKKLGDEVAPILKETGDQIYATIAPDVAKLDAARNAKLDASNPATALLDDWNGKLLQQAGDRLAILDYEHAQAIAKLQSQLKDKESLGEAILLVNRYYDNEILAEKNKANEAMTAAAKATREAVLIDMAAARVALDKQREESIKASREGALAGKSGLGAAVRQNLAGTEMISGIGEAAGAGPLAAIFAAVGKFLPTLTNLVAVLNPLQTIIDAALEVLGPLINNLLAPMVGVLKIIGYTIGKMLAPALELLRPIIQMQAELFVWLYNTIFVPIGNLIITLWNMVYNAFADFINGILWLVDQIPFVDVGRVEKKDINSGLLQTVSLDMAAATGSSGGNAGGSASYAAGTSVRIEKIEIKADFIAGEAGLMDVAVKIRDLIFEAERIGR